MSAPRGDPHKNRIAAVPEYGWRVEYRDRTRREMRQWAGMPPDAWLDAFFDGFGEYEAVVVRITESASGSQIDTEELRESEIAAVVRAVTTGLSKRG